MNLPATSIFVAPIIVVEGTIILHAIVQNKMDEEKECLV